MPGSMFFTFLVSLAGMTCLYVTLWKYELASKSAHAQLRRLRRALVDEDDWTPGRRSAAPQL
jgi:heme exporter protein C